MSDDLNIVIPTINLSGHCSLCKLAGTKPAAFQFLGQELIRGTKRGQIVTMLARDYGVKTATRTLARHWENHLRPSLGDSQFIAQSQAVILSALQSAPAPEWAELLLKFLTLPLMQSLGKLSPAELAKLGIEKRIRYGLEAGRTMATVMKAIAGIRLAEANLQLKSFQVTRRQADRLAEGLAALRDALSDEPELLAQIQAALDKAEVLPSEDDL